MKYSSIGNFTSRKQLANGESFSCTCFFFHIMIDTRVNSDLAKTKIVTFALKINSKSVSKTTLTRGECGNG